MIVGIAKYFGAGMDQKAYQRAIADDVGVIQRVGSRRGGVPQFGEIGVTADVLELFLFAKQIGERTGGALKFTLASLYPLLYEMEKRGWAEGRWQANHAGRDRRYYHLTASGRKQLVPLRQEWRAFFQALDSLAGVSHA